MNEELKKALEALIEETISDIEELKKSRFAAAEIKIAGPGADGIAGKPADGSLGKEEDEAEKAEDKKEDKDADKSKDEDKAEKADSEDKDDEKAKDEAEKSEGKNREADPNGGHHKMDKAEGKNREADPNGGHHKMDKAEADEKEGGKDHEKKEKKKIKELADMHDMGKGEDKMGYGGAVKKSEEERDSLMKSYIDSRVAPLETKLSSILDLVNKIADQPVAPKGVTSRMQPLAKSGEFVEPLSKGDAAAKLFELKKSGTKVDTLDIAKAEQGVDLQAIVKKYNLV